jgi:peptidoglycan lytic transglycosylase
MKRMEALSRSVDAAHLQALAVPVDAVLSFAARARFALGLAGLGALSLAGCAQAPPVTHGSEYFPSAVYGAASPQVVGDAGAVPHGGGTYKVGQPYVVAGKTYYPSNYKRYSGVGYASWYGDAFHGRRTANGEIYDRDSISAAHPTMPLPSYARVTNLRNHYSIVVRVNDRGPFARGRVMDVSKRVAELLDFRRSGTTKVKIDYIGAASLAGSDDKKLAQTLRQDGGLAQLDMRHPPNYVAETEPVQPVQTASAEPVAQDPSQAAPDSQTASLQQTAAANDAIAAIPATEVFKGRMPLPPSRPFDLDAGNADSSVLQ